MTKLHYSLCPVCNSPSIGPALDAKDFSVSGEIFMIWECAVCGLRFTQDVPKEPDILPYYRSENYISHSNTSKGVINRIYQFVRKFTLARKAKLVITKTQATGEILDIGAGIGAFLNTMREKGWNIKGIEPDQGARHLALSLFNIRLDDAGNWSRFSNTFFDAITLWHVLEHVHQLHEYMDRLKSLLKPDGKIFIAVPNYTSFDQKIYKGHWAAYDVPRHLYHFSPKAMRFLLERHGLRLIAIRPMWFDSFYISLISSRYKNGTTNWFTALWNGLRSNFKCLTDKSRCSSLIYVVQKN